MNLRTRGFTLLELLVSIGVLSVLGTALTVLLYDGMNMWRQGERRRQMFERSAVAFDLLREDLSAMLPPPADQCPEALFEYRADPSYKDPATGRWERISSRGIAQFTITEQNNLVQMRNEFEACYRRSDPSKDGSMVFRFDLGRALLRRAELSARAEGIAQMDLTLADSGGAPSATWTALAGGTTVHEVGESVTYTVPDNTDLDRSKLYVRLILKADENERNTPPNDKLLRGGPGSPPALVLRGQVEHPWVPDLPGASCGQIFTADDTNGRRLMFWRTIGPNGDIAQREPGEDNRGKPGDVAEVVYLCHNSKLWRALNTDKTRSLFVPDNNGIYPLPTGVDNYWLPVADGVLFFGVRFWDRQTEYWSKPPNSAMEEARWTWGETDGVPMKLQAVLVLRPMAMGGYVTRLAQGIADTTPPPPNNVIHLERAVGLPNFGTDDSNPCAGREAMHVLIGDEWIRYESVVGSQAMVVPEDGRGQRAWGQHGAAAAHLAGSDVLFGETRVLTIELPAARPGDLGQEQQP